MPELAVSGRTRSAPIHVPYTRLSILDPCLESEPSVECCLCSQMLALYVNHHPIAVLPGTYLDCVTLSARLHQLRHRNPRQVM